MTDEHSTGLHRDWKSAHGGANNLDSRFDAIARFLARRAARNDFDELMKAMALNKGNGSQEGVLQ